MWDGKRVSVVLMTYAEKGSIRGVIEDFAASGVVDEILVVNNNAEPGTSEEVARTNAVEVHEPRQGYGHATRRGLLESSGDLVVLAEPDGTFLAQDIQKLLVYSKECDAVFGTRTTRELIWHGANMEWFLRWGNWAVAKLVEFLFNTGHLSDVGCSYRLFSRSLANTVANQMKVGGNHAGAEILMLTVSSKAKFVEVPVNYLPRVGKSAATGSISSAIRIGLRMIGLILRWRIQSPMRQDEARIAGGAGANDGQAAHFDQIAEQYDDSLPPHVVEHYLEKRTRLLRANAPPGGAVLDVGCGTGTLAARVEEEGLDVTGIDPSQGMIEMLRKQASGVEAVVGSGSELPFDTDSFDLVYCVAVLHHIADREDVKRTLAEMVRVAKPGGRVIVWDHNPRNPYWKLLMARVPQDTGEERLVPEEEIVTGLTAAGARLEVSSQLGMVPDFTPPRFVGLAARFEHLAERTPALRRICAHNVILAEKRDPDV